jgi:hypothetical protein
MPNWRRSRHRMHTRSRTNEDGGDGVYAGQDLGCITMSRGACHITEATSPTPGHIELSRVQSECTLSSERKRRTLYGREADNYSLLPAIAFTLDMYRRTGEFFGINEALFSSALAAMVFSLFAAQPLTIVGVTGLIGLFNYTIYDIVGQYDVIVYPQVMAWTGIWAAIFHWTVSFGNLCDYMGYITDFSSESFGMYVGIIYMGKFYTTATGVS